MIFSAAVMPTTLVSTLQLGAAARAAAPTEVPSLVARQARTGAITFYTPGLGSCGKTSSESDLVVAVGAPEFDKNTPNGNPNNNKLCGKQIKVTAGGKSVTVTIVDKCPACSANDLDLSPAAFNKIADPSAGRVQASWQFL
ncbi:RlpA-like double-psi beta-barrel-protein domain-containing protein-containing protein [Podospora didyma]|uniref:RlpA-like double-psi beta-barrel-protein domain-containing protein-containing protein n=1 Tax=Podospora didyma TaxID=330526 RepID=A0AAE0N742_9PEZI|nr:RlpA-like double-psi beta-barrel-protein domain-containing protein-containing protein [Podospora didyma]